ncbi:hypothetical protein FHR70_002491 [Microvirga lupini]|uniref:Uncharacterized protein n=1 Tax=Microvirga lupini TaxID=420324 RepID=A0A7W4VM84_9HYPH|nr:hypothetical protein [Microvirga lupini]MBB3019426.1 hypothetical protein [Microvirga lupini]
MSESELGTALAILQHVANAASAREAEYNSLGLKLDVDLENNMVGVGYAPMHNYVEGVGEAVGFADGVYLVLEDTGELTLLNKKLSPKLSAQEIEKKFFETVEKKLSA